MNRIPALASLVDAAIDGPDRGEPSPIEWAACCWRGATPCERLTPGGELCAEHLLALEAYERDLRAEDERRHHGVQLIRCMWRFHYPRPCLRPATHGEGSAPLYCAEHARLYSDSIERTDVYVGVRRAWRDCARPRDFVRGRRHRGARTTFGRPERG